MEELNRDFKGIWIPKGIWLDKRLNALDKIILVEIDSLDATEEGCYASNKYLADFCQCTETKISTSIKKLVELGYIKITSFDGRKRYIKSRLKEIERQTLKNLKADFKKIKDNNIYNNIDNNNNNIKINKKEELYEMVESNFGRTLSPLEYEEISQWEDNEITRYAIKEAVLRRALSVKYINAIIRDCEAKGIKTIKSIRKAETNEIEPVLFEYDWLEDDDDEKI